MAKPLRTIAPKGDLNGVKSAAVETLSLGKKPGVDYSPKAPDDQKFVAQHKVNKHADRVGNGDDVYKGTTKEAPYMKMPGHTTEETIDEGNADNKLKKNIHLIRKGINIAKSNDIHTKSASTAKKLARANEEVEQVDELSKKTLGSYINQAKKDTKDRSDGIVKAIKKKHTTEETILEDYMYETAPPNPKIEKWILDNKSKFSSEYGDKKGKEVLYATAWKKYQKEEAETSTNKKKVIK